MASASAPSSGTTPAPPPPRPRGGTPFWKTYVALLLLAALGSYAWFVESKREDTRTEKPKEKVLAVNKARVKEVGLAPAGGEAVRVVREGGAWRLVAPLEAPADAGAVESILGSLESLEVEEVVVETGAKLAEFGLEPPKNTVSVLQEGASKPLEVLLGDKTPDGSGLYARLPTHPRVFTIGTFHESSFDKKPFDLRDRDLLHVKRQGIETLAVTGPEGSYALERDDKGDWAFTRPVATRAGRWAVEGLVGTLESLRFDSVAAESAGDLKPFGLDKPARTVTLGLEGGGTKTLEIGKEAGEKKHHARDAATRFVVVVPGAIVDDLAKGMSELRAKRLLEVATYEVEGIDATVEGANKAWARTTTKDKEGVETQKWARTAPDRKDAELAKVQDALFAMGGLEVQGFVDAPGPPETYGLDAPALKVTLRHAGGKPPVWFELGRKGDAVYARREGDTAILKLDAKKAEELVKSFKEL